MLTYAPARHETLPVHDAGALRSSLRFPSPRMPTLAPLLHAGWSMCDNY